MCVFFSKPGNINFYSIGKNKYLGPRSLTSSIIDDPSIKYKTIKIQYKEINCHISVK